MGSTERLPTLDIGLPGWRLRAWHESDALSLARHVNNVNILRWMSDTFPRHYTPELAEHWVRHGHIEFGGDNWALTLDDEAVGGCGIHQQAAQFRCVAEVGWWLAEPHWGRGVMSHAARVLVSRALDNPQIARVFAPIHAGNARSMAVARHAGMHLEGVQRQSALKDGRVIDRHIYVCLRER